MDPYAVTHIYSVVTLTFHVFSRESNHAMTIPFLLSFSHTVPVKWPHSNRPRKRKTSIKMNFNLRETNVPESLYTPYCAMRIRVTSNLNLVFW